jgi:hypothetical protein
MPTYWIITDESGSVIGLYLNHDDAHEDVKREGMELEWTVQGIELVDRPMWPYWYKLKIQRLENEIVLRGNQLDKIKVMGKHMPNKCARLRREIIHHKAEIMRLTKAVKEFRLNRLTTFSDSV